MGDFQRKNGASWEDIPDYAHPDDEGGEISLEYPEPTARDGVGAPCGAVGLPHIVIRSKIMRGDGWMWWQNLFSDTTSLYVTIPGITAFDKRSGTWKKFTGKLFRPNGLVRPASTLTRTIFQDVEIIVDSVTETT